MKHLKKNFQKNKILYISIVILTFIFVTGVYFAFSKFLNKQEKKQDEVVKIKKNVSEELTSKEWVWSQTITSNSQKITPRVSEFILKINSDGSFSSSTDCNSLSGELKVNKEKISFVKMVASEKFCPKSLEANFISSLSEVETYRFNEKKQLILILKDESGFMFFNELKK